MKKTIKSYFSPSRDAPPTEILDVCRTIEDALGREKKLLFGLDLFHECLRCLHEGNEVLLKATHDELLAAVLYAEESVRQTEQFLGETLAGHVSAERAREFRVDALHGCPRGEDLRVRAEKLLGAYDICFPGRPFSQTLEKTEVLRLLDAAALSN